MTPAATIGSSEVATALGYNPWGSPLRLWLRLTGRLPRYGGADTAASKRGRGMEWGLLAWFATERGFRWTPGPDLDSQPMRHPTLGFLHSRVDGYVWEHQDRPANAVADAKTSRLLAEVIELDNGRTVPGWRANAIPAHLHVQMLVHLACHPLAERCYVPALGTLDDDWRVYTIERDERRIRKLEDAVEAWWDRHIVNGIPPEEDGRDDTTEALTRAWAAAPGAVVEATSEDRGVVGALKAKRATLRDLERETERLRQKLMMRMGSATELVDGRNLIATFRETKAGRRLVLRNHTHDHEE